MLETERYRFGPFALEVNERELCRGDVQIPLPGKAFDLLITLIRAAGRTVTKRELMAILWPDTAVEESNLTQTVFILRKALGEDNEQTGYILTVPRRGYKFVFPVVNGSTVESNDNAAQPLWSRPRLLAIGIVIGIAGAGAGFTYLRPKPPVSVDLSAYHYRPFAYTQEYERIGAWSPDGKTIAFVQGRDDQSILSRGLRLMAQPSDGGAATVLAERIIYSKPSWSPDGTRVYFRKTGGIYSVSTAGGEPELVLKDNAFIAGFDLSPDGKALAIWRAPRAADGSTRGSVWVSSPPGTELHEYTPTPFAVPESLAAVVRFSPNSKTLYVSMTTFNGNQAEIWLLPFPPGSGSPKRIFRNVSWRDNVQASWLPDSRRLVFSTNIAPMVSPALWVADIRNESLTKLTDGSVRQENPAVSPDGQRLLFTRVDEDADIVELPLDGSAPRKLLATSASEYSPGWSPKGGELAYVTQRNGTDEMWLRSWPGDWERPIVTSREFPNLQLLGTPLVSPDGSRIAYTAILRDPRRVGSIYISPRTGGAPTWIASATGPSWSPDGASLAFVWRNPNGAPVLATLRIGSNQQPFQIADVACVPPLTSWSPSGEWIACSTGKGQVLVSSDGKTKRVLPSMDAATLAWSKDGQTLYALHNEDGRWSLLAQDVRTSSIRKMADYGFEITPWAPLSYFGLRLSLSPDGKSFAVGTLKRQTDLWILEGFPK